MVRFNSVDSSSNYRASYLQQPPPVLADNLPRAEGCNVAAALRPRGRPRKNRIRRNRLTMRKHLCGTL